LLCSWSCDRAKYLNGRNDCSQSIDILISLHLPITSTMTRTTTCNGDKIGAVKSMRVAVHSMICPCGDGRRVRHCTCSPWAYCGGRCHAAVDGQSKVRGRNMPRSRCVTGCVGHQGETTRAGTVVVLHHRHAPRYVSRAPTQCGLATCTKRVVCPCQELHTRRLCRPCQRPKLWGQEPFPTWS
jgi:hypothetical protein